MDLLPKVFVAKRVIIRPSARTNVVGSVLSIDFPIKQSQDLYNLMTDDVLKCQTLLLRLCCTVCPKL